MVDVKLNLEHSGISKKNIMEYKEQVEIIHKDLHSRAEIENDFVRMA